MTSHEWLYQLRDGIATPSPLTQGPWMRGAQHGGPPSSLLTVLLESVTTPEQLIARISVELLAPVPMTPLSVSVRKEQLSRRVGIATAELASDGTVVARATGRLLATGEAPPPPITGVAATPPGPETLPAYEAPAWAVGKHDETFHRDALEYRWIAGDFEQSGPAYCWLRLLVPVVDGIEVTGYQRVMAGADIASGIGAVYPPSSRYGLINSDLDVAFVRPADGIWTLTDATTRTAGNATGLCSNTISDQQGVVATGTQTLLGRPFTFE